MNKNKLKLNCMFYHSYTGDLTFSNYTSSKAWLPIVFKNSNWRIEPRKIWIRITMRRAKNHLSFKSERKGNHRWERIRIMYCKGPFLYGATDACYSKLRS